MLDGASTKCTDESPLEIEELTFRLLLHGSWTIYSVEANKGGLYPLEQPSDGISFRQRPSDQLVQHASSEECVPDSIAVFPVVPVFMPDHHVGFRYVECTQFEHAMRGHILINQFLCLSVSVAGGCG
jgi:hypothetical protein